jgi:NAD(P)H-hydrate epimerase
VDVALEWADVLSSAPGPGRGEDRRRLVSRVLEGAASRPVVLDADGLNVWEGRADELAERLPESAVLTPHPGELARLMEGGIDEIVSDPLGAARAAARRFGRTVLLKGAPTVVAPADGPVRVSPFMGPELATGGTGDVLSGLVGALLAAGSPPADAAASALFLAGLAASRCDAPVGHLSADIPGEIPRAREDVLAGGRPSRDAVNFVLPAPRRR